MQGQSVISVALKTPLEIRFGICTVHKKRQLCLYPMTILVSRQAVPHTFYNKIAPMFFLGFSYFCLSF